MSLQNFMRIERAVNFFVDKHGFKRPLPPPGYVEFDYFGLDHCPNCRTFQCGWAGIGGKDSRIFVDDKAQEFYDIECANEEGNPIGYDWFCKEFEGDMIKCHWSRFHEMECCTCGCKAWGDFISGSIDSERHINSMHYYLPCRVDWEAIREGFEKRFIWRLKSDEGNIGIISNWIEEEWKHWHGKKDCPFWTFYKVAEKFGVVVNSSGAVETTADFCPEKILQKSSAVSPTHSVNTTQADGSCTAGEPSAQA